MLIAATDRGVPEKRYDLAIVGAGAAGITVAHALAGSNVSVCLIESGGFDLDGRTQALYEGTLIGRDYADLDVLRLRYFGGSTNHWGGWCRPLGPEHFEARPWLSMPGWPIERQELLGYFAAAHRFVELENVEYDLGRLAERGSLDPAQVWALDGPLQSELYRFSAPTRFGEVYRKRIVEAENIDLLLGSNVTRIVMSHDMNYVQSLEVASFERESFSIAAENFVLATGAVEVPRLLLASNEVAPAGIGNAYDLVGRYFMEHPHLNVGQFAPALGVPMQLYDVRANYHARQPALCLAVSSRLREELGILGCSFELWGIYEGEDSPGAEALKTIVRSMRHGRLPDHFSDLALEVVSNLDDVSRAVLTYLSSDREDVATYMVNCFSEQEPNPESRVVLTGEKDELGMPRVALNWRLTDLDFRTVKEATHRLAAALGAAGLGRMRIDLGDDWPENLSWGWHQMGTTRMSNSPKHGVVDRDCRVHGVANLFVLGSSVFPYSGSGVPTLSIVALALRFVDKLRNG